MMDYKEQAKRKHDSYAKSTWTSELEISEDCAVFYTKDGHGYIRKHKYCDGAISIDLVTEIPIPVVEEPVVTVTETVAAPEVVSEPPKSENTAKQKTKKTRGKKNGN